MKRAVISFYTIILMCSLLVLGVGNVQAGPCELPEFDPGNFRNPGDPPLGSITTDINNQYWPLDPGTTFVYEPFPNEDDVVNTITVTNDIKDIYIGTNKIVCRVVHDEETVFGGTLSEETDDWYAQDIYGNIWYFGEDTIAYQEGGSTSTEGSWEAGVDGALPGIVMLADPQPGVCYKQEFYEGEAEDVAKVLRLNANVSIENGDYEGCLKTKEWTPLSPGNIEHKYYAPGVGLVYIEELKEKTVKVELVDKY